MTRYRLLKCALVATSMLAIPAAHADQSLSAEELYDKANALGAAGLRATFRSQMLTVSGTFARFADTTYGTTVSVEFEHNTAQMGWKLICDFPRDDTASYDKFALMQPGTPITATGKFADASDSYARIYLEPCSVD